MSPVGCTGKPQKLEWTMQSRQVFLTKIRLRLLLPMLLLAALFSTSTVHAQEGEPILAFRLNKIFGYALGSSIQGSFNVSVSDDEDLIRIALLVDGVQVGYDEEAPFRIQFSTSDFTPENHSIQVRGITAEGEEIASRIMELTFLSSEQARTQTIDFIVPLLVVVLVVMVLAAVFPALLGRRKNAFQPGSYGPSGGAVCSRCQLPFSRSFLSPNLMIGKFERCPHCGRWGIVRRASSADLEAAETRLATTFSSDAIQQEDEASLLRRMVDDSRYEGDN